MSIALRSQHLSKMYRLGPGKTSLRETLSGLAGNIAQGQLKTPATDPFWALRDASFELDQGQSLGLVGPNGAGKTTVLKLLARITPPTSGRILLYGRVVALIELGAGFHPDLSGRENIYLNGAILGIPAREIGRVFDEIVAFSGLDGFIDTPVKRYSSGMYVRLGFSVAAHVAADILLVDEVLAVGDAAFRQRCAQRIAELRRKGTSIIFVSHILPLVRSVCERGIFLANGLVHTQGDVVAAINAYETYMQRRKCADREVNGASGWAELERSPVAIQHVEVSSFDGSGGEALVYSQAAEIRVRFTARRPIRKPNLVLRFTNAEGVTAGMIRSADYGYRLEDLQGEGTIAVIVDPLQLNWGAYSVEARLVGELDGLPLAERHSGWFQVRGLSAGHGESGGVFVPRLAGVTIEQGAPAGQALHLPLE